MLVATVGTGAVLSVLPYDDALRVELELGGEPADQILQLLPAELLGRRCDPMPDTILPRETQRVRARVVEIGGIAAHQLDALVVLAVADVGKRPL